MDEATVFMIAICIFFIGLFGAIVYSEHTDNRVIEACIKASGSPVVVNGDLKECKR